MIVKKGWSHSVGEYLKRDRIKCIVSQRHQSYSFCVLCLLLALLPSSIALHVSHALYLPYMYHLPLMYHLNYFNNMTLATCTTCPTITTCPNNTYHPTPKTPNAPMTHIADKWSNCHVSLTRWCKLLQDHSEVHVRSAIEDVK
jgi:hypothetical protein